MDTPPHPTPALSLAWDPPLALCCVSPQSSDEKPESQVLAPWRGKAALLGGPQQPRVWLLKRAGHQQRLVLACLSYHRTGAATEGC